MPCDCSDSSLQLNMSNPIMSGIVMGVGIFATDMILRPQFTSSQMMELLLFAVEGIVCDLIYGGINSNLLTGSINFKRSVLAGLTLWLTDFFLRPAFVGGIGMEIMKFLLQGIFVLMVFNYSGGMSAGSADTP